MPEAMAFSGKALKPAPDLSSELHSFWKKSLQAYTKYCREIIITLFLCNNLNPLLWWDLEILWV
jgi:hypothetical protein